MTVVNVLIVVGVVVAILTLGLALAAAVIMAFMALGLAIAGTITCAPSIAVMWICFFGVLVLIAQLGHIKREALRVARKQ